MGSESQWGSEDQTRHTAYEVAVEKTIWFQNRTSTLFEGFISPLAVGGDSSEEIARAVAFRVERGTGTSGRTPGFKDERFEQAPAPTRARSRCMGSQRGELESDARTAWRHDARVGRHGPRRLYIGPARDCHLSTVDRFLAGPSQAPFPVQASGSLRARSISSPKRRLCAARRKERGATPFHTLEFSSIITFVIHPSAGSFRVPLP
jgi:hypothetical protein